MEYASPEFGGVIAVGEFLPLLLHEGTAAGGDADHVAEEVLRRTLDVGPYPARGKNLSPGLRRDGSDVDADLAPLRRGAGGLRRKRRKESGHRHDERVRLVGRPLSVKVLRDGFEPENTRPGRLSVLFAQTQEPCQP